jgi:hypothetical protein
MNKTATLCIFLAISVIAFSFYPAYAQTPRFIVKINQEVFAPGDTVVLYGKAAEGDALFVKILDPANKTVRIESIFANESGSFTAQVYVWPEASRNLVFGTYTVEVSSSRFLSDKATFQISFAEQANGGAAPAQHVLVVKLDSPTEVSAGNPFRIFVQTTFDGELVKADPAEMLASSHIHSGEVTINLAGTLKELHEGIYYADVTLEEEGTYIIHSIAFYRGFRAHDSKVVSSGSSIGDIQNSVDTLKAELDRTSRDLNETRSAITQSVEDAQAAIRNDLEQAEGTVNELRDASGQINSLILPILALISVIIALQISLFARIRASFK